MTDLNLSVLPRECQECLQCLRQVTGGVEQPDAGDYHYRITGFGRELRFSLSGYERFSSVTVAVPLLGRPIAVVIAGAGSSVSNLPAVPLDDAAFASCFQAAGAPPSAVAEMLDEPARRWLAQTFGRNDPQITSRGDFLEFNFPNEILRWPAGGSGPPTFSPHALDACLRAAVGMTDALVRGFDREHARVAQAQGPAAAQAWLQQAAERKRRGATVFNPRAALLLVLILGGLAATVTAVVLALRGC